MIDAHHHIWQLGQHDCIWPTPADSAIYRDFGLDDFLPLAQACGVRGSVLIQSQRSDRDTDYLLQQANNNDFIKAVVGWVDLAAPSAVKRIAQLARNKKLRGLRPMLQNMASDDWILKSELRPALDAMQEHGLCFDALVKPQHLPHILSLAHRHPALRLVIDHGGKPAIALRDKSATDNWREAITQLATLPQVYCKLSGVLSEADAAQNVEALRPYVEHLFQCFGAQRLMWGSDWPVIYAAPNDRYAGYAPWLTLAQQLIQDQNAHATEQVFSLTARTFYRFL